MSRFSPRDPLTIRYARTLREASRDPFDFFYCAHKAKPFNPWPAVCAAAAIGLLLLARYF